MKLSIITINYNNCNGLLTTIKSVVQQSVKDFEFIIIDGGSTDGSVPILNQYNNEIDYWVSEPDNGIYHAMNKGVRIAHCEFCLFLNSGDWLYSNTVIERILPFLDLEIDLLSGFQWGVPEDKRKAFRIVNGSPKQLYFYALLTKFLSHGSTFIRRELLIRRPYDESMKIVADWKFFVETVAQEECRYQHVDIDICYFDLTGISSVSSKLWEEGQSTRDAFIHPKLLEEIKQIPPDIIQLYGFMRPTSVCGKISLKFIKLIALLYSILSGRIREYYLLFSSNNHIKAISKFKSAEENFLYLH